ncbi:hypothetical protein APX70_04952 [Pseudomonas syringae pv. maculicola]|uniref:Uncharacterized protein n=1 Tax=Pseudomonas syringae pv. maculicola TaxID=59511 RepID=A0A3M2W0B9_PSEYM|nr:hypothetical protein APX70_04952 [Pseudomonas syringae pv. maculicola]
MSGVHAHVIVLAKACPALVDAELFRVFFGGGGGQQDRHHQDRRAAFGQHPKQFGHGLAVVGYVLEYMRTHDEVERLVGVHVHVHDIDHVVSQWREQVGRAIPRIGQTAQKPGKQHGWRDV